MDKKIILIFLAHPAHFHLFRTTIAYFKDNGVSPIVVIKSKDILEKLLNDEGVHFINILRSEKKTKSKIGLLFEAITGLIIRDIKLLKIAVKHKPRLLIGTDWAVAMRTFEWGGYRYGKDRLAVMAGGSLLPNNNQSLKDRIKYYINNYYTMPITHMNATVMDGYFSEIKKQKIRFLRGYASAIYTFAEHLSQRQQTLPFEAVFTTAEMLYPHQRDLMKKVFLCDIYDTYGCRDGMGMAVDCEMHKGMHICPEMSIMHIVDESGKEVKAGETGEVVLTSLYDYTMPLIRYAPGDLAIKSDRNCPCGRSLPMIEKIVGRSSDVFKLINGRVLNGLSITIEDLFEEFETYQIVQEAIDRVEMLLVPRKEIKPGRLQSLEEMLAFHCGEGVEVKAKIVDTIEVPQSGKFRYVISKVN